MKRTYTAISCFILIISSMLIAQANPAIPSFDQVTKIGLLSHKGWMLNIYPDGSASLIYGSNPMDVAKAPKQSFSFQEVYNLLVPHLSDTYKEGKTIAVTLHVTGQTSSISLYLEDKATIKKIMSQARDKSVPLDQTRFKELLQKHSPVPDEDKSQ